jgi:hypothetical protein
VSRSEKPSPWKVIVLLLVIAAGIVLAWWRATGPSGVLRDMPAACSKCGFAGTTKVGDTPKTEEWPRECPQCHEKHFYLAGRCPLCKKFIPMKDPEAEKLGTPRECPSCKRPYYED